MRPACHPHMTGDSLTVPTWEKAEPWPLLVWQGARAEQAAWGRPAQAADRLPVPLGPSLSPYPPHSRSLFFLSSPLVVPSSVPLLSVLFSLPPPPTVVYF